ncbi:hypothetical protein [Streptomyces sp. NPDC007088]|uniref:hypothetical protein n=1 Tax=Streptomyces sp. NPDC007088 TaxID=3364773 RepID=UPI0036B35021
MAGRTPKRHPLARWRGPLAALAGVLLLGASGCAAPQQPGAGRQHRAEQAVRALLDRRARAVLDRDEQDWLATADPRAGAVRGREHAAFDRLDDLPFSSWSYRLLSLKRTGHTASARAELSYRLRGYDAAPVTVDRALSLGLRGKRWYVASERPAPKSPPQLWEQGEVNVVDGRSSVVLGVGQSRERLREFAALADRAVPAVRRAWTGDWPGRLVVVVPRSLDAMAALLGASPGDYRGIAAVTTGELGGLARVPADRVTVNPAAFGELGSFGKQFVLTHEAAHVATRSSTSSATPLWLSEGFADWTGYRGTGRTPAEVAPELAKAVRAGQGPRALPGDGAFGFATDPDRLARAYESGWLACRMIAEQWGEASLRDFYRAVGVHDGRSGAVDAALREVLGLDTARFTKRWRAYLREQLA